MKTLKYAFVGTAKDLLKELENEVVAEQESHEYPEQGWADSDNDLV